MNPLVGWALAGIGTALAYMRFGWRGVALALSAVVFWLLLQFSATLRAMRAASVSPVGSVVSAVMLHARLRKGMRLVQVIRLARSLGRPLDARSEGYAWADRGGDRVELFFEHGRLRSWTLQRAATGADCPRSDDSPGALS